MTARTSVHAETIDRLMSAIQAGEYQIGSPLPSERALAHELEISRNTLREAIRALDNAGVVQIRGRSGTMVLPAAMSATAVLRARAEATGDHSPLDLIVARLAVEPACAELAALQHTTDDAHDIERALEAQADAVSRGDDPFEPDLHFHTVIARASHNPALIVVQGHLAQMMHSTLWTELKGEARRETDSAELYLGHHTQLARAILDRDARRAGQLMCSHLVEIETSLREHAASHRDTTATRRND